MSHPIVFKRLIPLFLFAVLAPTLGAQEVPVEAAPAEVVAADESPAMTRAPWSPEIVKIVATLPVQDGGRVKPFDTFAQFTMLQINGKRSFMTDSGEKLTPVPWMLDTLFYPEIARTYQHFVVDNYDVISAMDVKVHDTRRSRYSYEELEPGISTLMQHAQEYSAIDPKKRDLVQQGVLDLANSVVVYTHLIHFLDFTQRRFTVDSDTELGKAFPEEEGVPLSVTLERSMKVLGALRGTGDTMGREAVQAVIADFSTLLEQVEGPAMQSDAIAMFPTPNLAEEAWQTPADMVALAISDIHGEPVSLKMLGDLEALPALRDDRSAFTEAIGALHEDVAALATKRGEYSKVPLEVHYYRGNYIFFSQVLFVLSFLLIAATWLLPKGNWNFYVSTVAVSIPTILLIIGIVLRCVIRSRPPISTLYETVLFITATVVLVSLFIEYVNRQRVAIAMGAFLGMAGMFLAHRYEMKEGVDTMPSLVAVLDTNFWLATHVTIINIGYAAGMLSGAIAHVYIVSRLFNFMKDNKEYYRSLNRMVYGVLAFGLIFSTVGTILGGIWANDSWGRFWGWDPKENGALMIVLWSLVILHAKMGRYIKELGISQGAIILAMIVAFSWWGVNQLGVGLHSYGFTSGIMNALAVYWIVELLFVGLGAIVWFRDRNQSAPKEATAS